MKFLTKGKRTAKTKKRAAPNGTALKISRTSQTRLSLWERCRAATERAYTRYILIFA